MGRILYITAARPGGAAHWARVAGAMAAAAVFGVGVARLIWGAQAPADTPQAPVATTGAARPASAGPAPLQLAVAPAQAVQAALPVSCPIQQLQLALNRAPARTVCMDATLLQQTGSVRSYAVRAGDAEGWTLRIDMAERALLAVSLQARDGRSFGCAAPHCAGQVSIVAPQGAGQGSLVVRELRLAPRPGGAEPAAATPPAGAVLDATLRVPSDDQVPGLACTGPSVTVSAANGSARRFCGQGGSGVEFADEGRRVYRLQDHEARTLTVALDAEQRVVEVTWDGLACRGGACSGASTSSADPSNPLAERSFYFGRTALFGQDSAAGGRPTPAAVLDGSLVVPAQ